METQQGRTVTMNEAKEVEVNKKIEERQALPTGPFREEAEIGMGGEPTTAGCENPAVYECTEGREKVEKDERMTKEQGLGSGVPQGTKVSQTTTLQENGTVKRGAGNTDSAVKGRTASERMGTEEGGQGKGKERREDKGKG